MSNLSISEWRAGARFGLFVGAIIHGAGSVGIALVSTAFVSLLAVWFIGQTFQTGVLGAGVGQGFVTSRPRRLAIPIVTLDIVFVEITIALQDGTSIGTGGGVLTDRFSHTALNRTPPPC